MSSRSSPWWLCGNLCTGHTYVHLHVAGIQNILSRYLEKNTKAIWYKQKLCCYHGTISGLHKSIPSFLNFSLLKSGHQQKIAPAKILKFGHLWKFMSSKFVNNGQCKYFALWSNCEKCSQQMILPLMYIID